MKYNYRSPYWNELYHYGMKGQKWGVRRFQNPDGTLTSAGKQRYLTGGKIDSGKGLSIDMTPEGHKASLKAYERLHGKGSWVRDRESDDQKLREARRDMQSMSSEELKVLEDFSNQAYTQLKSTFDNEVSAGRVFSDEFFKSSRAARLMADTALAAHEEIQSRSDPDIVVGKDNPGVRYYKKRGDTFFDKNNDYGMDHDGNPIYNKSSKQVSEERASNKKLSNLTDGQYKRADMDLLESGGERYATQSLSVKQKLIRDYGNDRTDGSEYWSHAHGPRPTNQQVLQNQYDSYLDLHPNSELTFNEFNGWFYEN